MNRLAIALFAMTLAVSARAQTVSIGVLGLFHAREFRVLKSGATALAFDAGNEAGALAAQVLDAKLVGNQVIVTTGERTWRVARLRVHPQSADAGDMVLSVPGKIHRRYRGVLEIVPANGELVAIVTMDIETAVASAVAAESPPGAPLEALKAQAVATRSFLVTRASGHKSFDFCDTTHCQFLREPPPEHSLAARAARETSGMVLTYRGAPFAAMFASSCGGRTKTLEDIGLTVGDYPYFAVECRYCREHAEHWTRQLPRNAAGERERVAIGRVSGWSALPSNQYSSHASNEGVAIEGAGLGHGLGLCQKGGAAMAAEGKDFRAILEHYYPNAIIRVAQTSAAR